VEQSREINISLIQASAYNPRVYFDDVKLAELANSIRQKGVLEPILVRPFQSAEENSIVKAFAGLDSATTRQIFEIVAGERRWRASKMAGLEAVPAIIRALSDQEAAEIAIIENAQRANLTPVEEGRGIKTLIERFNYSTEDAAAKIGLSARTVGQRIRLLDLPKKALDAIEAGTLPLGSAVHLSRIPDEKLRGEATEAVLKGSWSTDHKPFGPSETLALIQRSFMTELSRAPFPTEDVMLVPEAGACGKCPHRSGNQQELFEEMKEKNLCLNTKCFATKKDAFRKRTIEEARAKNLKVLSDREAKAIFPYGHGTIAHGSQYVDVKDKLLDRSKPASKGTSYLKLVGKEVEPVVVVDPTGAVRNLYPKAQVSEALKKLGIKSDAGSLTTLVDGSHNQKSDSEKKREMQQKADRLGFLEALQVARISAQSTVPKFATPAQRTIWRSLAVGYLGQVWDDDLKVFTKAMEIEVPKGQFQGGMSDATNKWLAEATEEEAYVGCLIISLIRLGHYDLGGTKKKAMDAAFEVFNIDLKALRAAHLQALKDKAKPKNAPGKKPAKKLGEKEKRTHV